MAKQDAEVLTMARCRKLLEAHPAAARQRIASWLMAIAGERAPGDAPTPKDPRQESLFAS